MKTLLKHEFKIQLILIITLLSTFITCITLEDRLFSKIFIIDFFVLAFVQYTLNVIKFFNKKYLKTDSRIFYIYVSTFVVVSFLLYLLSDFFSIESLINIIEVTAITWIFSPILIFQSLCIAWSDSQNNAKKQNLID